MKKAARMLALSILVVATVVGAFHSQGSSLAQEKVTITFWNGFTGPDRPALEALVQQFNESQAEVEIEMTIMPWDSLYQTLLGALSSGEGPDIIGVNFNYVPVYASSGYVADLTEYLVEGTNLDPALWPEALVERLQYDGKFYAVPINFATLLMYYNKDLFAKAGLDPDNPPKTWDEWIAAIRATTGEGVYGIAIGERQTIPNWPILLWGAGGDVIIDGKSGLNSPETLLALNTWGPWCVTRGQSVWPYGGRS